MVTMTTTTMIGDGDDGNGYGDDDGHVMVMVMVMMMMMMMTMTMMTMRMRMRMMRMRMRMRMMMMTMMITTRMTTTIITVSWASFKHNQNLYTAYTPTSRHSCEEPSESRTPAADSSAEATSIAAPATTEAHCQPTSTSTQNQEMMYKEQSPEVLFTIFVIAIYCTLVYVFHRLNGRKTKLNANRFLQSSPPKQTRAAIDRSLPGQKPVFW